MRGEVKMLTLNIFMRPPPIHSNHSDYKNLRLRYFIQNILPKYDIVCLQEIFDSFTRRRKKLIKKAAQIDFHYYAECPPKSIFKGTIFDGGLLILSKFPIVQSEFQPFKKGVFPDRLANKGILYAKISVRNQILNVFTSHLQSKHPTDDSEVYMEYRMVRRKQLQQSIEFIKSKTMDLQEKAMFMGDLNVDGRETMKAPRFEVSYIQNIPCQDDYRKFFKIMSQKGSLDVIDLLRVKYGETPATFGRVDQYGYPLEEILTQNSEVTFDQGLDYILSFNFDENQINWDHTRVMPFYVTGKAFTQISDHAGLQTSIFLQ